MRYINKAKKKDKPHEIQEPQELLDWREKHDDKLTSMYQNGKITGKTLWGFIDDEGRDDICTKSFLKEKLLAEQGYICCYCGQRISNDSKTSIEHLQPKRYNKELTYRYDNLLASCNGGTSNIIHRVIEGETLDSIAHQYGVKVEDLEEIWVNDYYIEFFGKDIDIENISIGDRIIIIPKADKDQIHCDSEKSYKVIDINPLQEDCQSKFSFDIGSGEIIETGENKSTIEKLGLNNNPSLNRKRLNVINNSAIPLRSFIINEFYKDKTLLLSKLNEAIIKLEQKEKLDPFVFVMVNVLKGR